MPPKDKDAWVAKVLHVPVAEIQKRTGGNVKEEDRVSRPFLINESKLSDQQKKVALEGLGLCQFELEIFVKDHEGKPMDADNLTAFFESKDFDKTSTVGKLKRGYYYRKMVGAPTGNVIVTATSIDGGKYNKSMPEGNCPYVVKKGKVVLQARQNANDSSESGISKRDTNYAVGGGFEQEVGGEVEIEFLKASGKGVLKRSHDTTTGFGEEHGKTVSGKVPGGAFEVMQTN